MLILQSIQIYPFDLMLATTFLKLGHQLMAQALIAIFRLDGQIPDDGAAGSQFFRDQITHDFVAFLRDQEKIFTQIVRQKTGVDIIAGRFPELFEFTQPFASF